MKPFRNHHILSILEAYDTQDLPLDLFIRNYFRSHKSIGAHDRRFIANTTFHLLRFKGLIDELIKPPISWEKRLQFSLNTPLSNYLNNPSLPPHIRVSFPKEYFQLIEEAYGEEKALDICSLSNMEAPLYIRVNLLKTTKEALLERLSHKYEVTSSQCKSSIRFSQRVDLLSTPEFKDGLFEIQDEGSQMIASLVEAKPKDQVLDYCAGSGGKTLAFAPQMENTGQIYLHDIRQKPLLAAKTRLRKAGIQNAQIHYPNLHAVKIKMDWILLDVPCSGSGTLRRNVDMKWKFKKEHLSSLVATQRKIFEDAIFHLKNEGRIVYATCSIFPEENEQQIAYFMKTFDFKLEKTSFWLPEKDGPDGFFGAVLKR